MIKIIDNFLKKEDFENIYNIMTSVNFDWYYNQFINSELDINKKEFQFTHTFYAENVPRSTFIIIQPILQKIKSSSLLRIKANLLTKTNKIKEYGFHTDFDNKDNLITGIFYINTCNGYTLFKNGTKVESIANRFVNFDSKLEHAGTSCTDDNIRIVINFNYFK
jgi:hypothetical protein